MAMDILSLLLGSGRAPGGLVAPPRPTQAAYAYDPRVDPAIFPPQALQPGSAVGGFDSASAFVPQTVGGGPDSVLAPLVMKGDMGGAMNVASPEPIGRSTNLAPPSLASATGSGSILDMLGFNASNDLPVKFGTGTMSPSLPPVSGFSVPDSFGKLPSPAGTVPVSAPLPPVSGLGIERQTPRGDLSRPLIPSQPGLSRNPFDVQRGTLPAATEPAPVGDMVPPPQAAQSGQSGSAQTPEASGVLNKLFGANPQSEMYDRVVDMLTGWGMGAGGSWRDSLAMGSKNVAAGRLTRKQEADLAKSTNKTAEWARSRGVDEATIGMFLENKDAKGLISFVQQASGVQEPTNDIREYQFAQQQGYGGSFADWKSGGSKGNDYDTRRVEAERAGLDPNSDAYKSYVLTGKMPREDQQSLTATDKKAILEADEMVAANRAVISALGEAEKLSEKANQGYGASARAFLGNNLPDLMVPDAISSPESSEATANLDNAVVGQALAQLKTIFGGNPTEGERRILLDLQGASSQPKAVRDEIFTRARRAAEQRLMFNEERATSLRGGDFYRAQPSATAPMDPTQNAADPLGIR